MRNGKVDFAYKKISKKMESSINFTLYFLLLIDDMLYWMMSR